MKYNQYAYVETSPEKATEELLAINFLPENYSSLSFSELLAVLTGNVLAEATTRQAKDAKLAEFAVDDQTDLAAFLLDTPTAITASQFANVALQLLGYHPNYDYSLTDPLTCGEKHALPAFKDLTSKEELIFAFYRLLNTRSKNGQILLDVMAGKGYFTQFWGKASLCYSTASPCQFLTQARSYARSFTCKATWTRTAMARATSCRSRSSGQLKARTS